MRQIVSMRYLKLAGCGCCVLLGLKFKNGGQDERYMAKDLYDAWQLGIEIEHPIETDTQPGADSTPTAL